MRRELNPIFTRITHPSHRVCWYCVRPVSFGEPRKPLRTHGGAASFVCSDQSCLDGGSDLVAFSARSSHACRMRSHFSRSSSDVHVFAISSHVAAFLRNPSDADMARWQIQQVASATGLGR
jgi:hypothetical protein